MQERKIKLNSLQDAKDFVIAATKCDFDIDVFYNSVFIDGKSLLGVLSLDLRNKLTVRYQGENEEFEKFLEEHKALDSSAA
ncbi:MAG: HPr family phosphocarrier protein [Johnsonella sp.]|nr:HPr family phosphocarrier protein [Johnsonella sp.]